MPITVGQIRKILRGLPNDMSVLIGIEDDVADICAPNIAIAEVELTDLEDQSVKMKTVLIIPVCTCDMDEAPSGEINSQPELN